MCRGSASELVVACVRARRPPGCSARIGRCRSACGTTRARSALRPPPRLPARFPITKRPHPVPEEALSCLGRPPKCLRALGRQCPPRPLPLGPRRRPIPGGAPTVAAASSVCPRVRPTPPRAPRVAIGRRRVTGAPGGTPLRLTAAADASDEPVRRRRDAHAPRRRRRAAERLRGAPACSPPFPTPRTSRREAAAMPPRRRKIGGRAAAPMRLAAAAAAADRPGGGRRPPHRSRTSPPLPRRRMAWGDATALTAGAAAAASTDKPGRRRDAARVAAAPQEHRGDASARTSRGDAAATPARVPAARPRQQNSPPSPEDFVECRRFRPPPSTRWMFDRAPPSSWPAPRRHARADNSSTAAAFGTRPPARAGSPEPRDGFCHSGDTPTPVGALSGRRGAHAVAVAPAATRAVRRRFACPRAFRRRRPARRPPPLRLRAPARPLLPSADASSGRRGGPRWREGWRHCVIFGRCFCVLPWFCYKQACTIARPKYNFGIAVEKFGQAFFCHL